MYSLNPLFVEAYFEVMYNELLQEVERERLVRQASINKRQGGGLSQRMPVFRGKLDSLGQHLQENDGPASLSLLP